MSDNFNAGMAAVSALSKDQQDEVGAMLLSLAAKASEAPYRFTPEQEAEVRESLAAAERGEFASEEAVAKVFGLRA